jgi:DNA processing protein
VNTESLIHVNLIPGIGPATVDRLLGVSDVYAASYSDFLDLGIQPSQATALATGLADRSLIDRELKLIAQHHIGVVTLHDSDYPPLLRTIHAPPPVLYYLGVRPAANTGTGQNSLAVVGSRAAHSYARTVITRFIPPLVQAGCTIVSGGARGVDFLAHQMALDHKGTTIAVLGSGLLELYPATSKSLFARMAHEGSTVLSSFGLTTKPLAGNFPARNRIIAGLSRGCLVVQAAEKSGALITARFTLEQGREVFAVPGAIDDPLSYGCHRLIQQGAKLTQAVEDIAHELPDMLGMTQPESHQIPLEVSDELSRVCRTPRSYDELVTLLAIEPEALQGLLLNAMLSGTLTQNGAGLYEAR